MDSAGRKVNMIYHTAKKAKKSLHFFFPLSHPYCPWDHHGLGKSKESQHFLPGRHPSSPVDCPWSGNCWAQNFSERLNLVRDDCPQYSEQFLYLLHQKGHSELPFSKTSETISKLGPTFPPMCTDLINIHKLSYISFISNQQSHSLHHGPRLPICAPAKIMTLSTQYINTLLSTLKSINLTSKPSYSFRTSSYPYTSCLPLKSITSVPC